ncbi:TRAP transporter small permease [Pueribacillus sp. YX66]|uniref:TRAP transporter small permease n=1 Tax=Pueribacillus sp. YX66 TaxID=3229242 RepID=UPI00358D39D3
MIIKTINFLTNVTKGIALTVMAFMMFFVAFAVISRLIYEPILGDVEIVQLGMVVLIMCGLAYTQRVDGHISIGIIVDKMPYKGQKILDVIASLLNVIVTFVISFIFISVFLNHKNEMQLSTSLLEIPYYPFDFVIILGFTMWGLQALLKMINSFVELFSPNYE